MQSFENRIFLRKFCVLGLLTLLHSSVIQTKNFFLTPKFSLTGERDKVELIRKFDRFELVTMKEAKRLVELDAMHCTILI
jgi:hypothetical protein